MFAFVIWELFLSVSCFSGVAARYILPFFFLETLRVFALAPPFIIPNNQPENGSCC